MRKGGEIQMTGRGGKKKNKSLGYLSENTKKRSKWVG